MKKTILILLAMLLLLSAVPFANAAEQEDLSVISGCHSLDAANALFAEQNLVENCRSAILYELTTDTLLYVQNADERQFPSSIVKIMTVLICAEKLELSDTVTVKQEVLDTVPASAMRVELVAGEKLTVEQLLHSTMVGSGNDAAAVVADYAAGSQEQFVQLMNDRAAEIGCKDTNFVNVTGLHDEQQYTTARDSARILAEALKNEAFATIFSTIEYTVPSTGLSPTRYYLTANHMTHKKEYELYYDSRVKGGRTGVTEIGERNIAVWAQSGDAQLISVIFGSISETAADGYSISRFGGFLETMALLDEGFDSYRPVQILHKDQALRQCDVVGGDSRVVVGPSVDAATVLPDSVQLEDLDFRYTDVSSELKAPIHKGDKLSSVQVWYGSVCLGQADVYALSSVAVSPDITLTVDHEKEGGFGGWIVGILLVVVVIIGGFMAFRAYVYRAAKKRSRSRRKGMR